MTPPRDETDETIRRRVAMIERQFGPDWCRDNPDAFAKLYAATIVMENLKKPRAPRRATCVLSPQTKE